MANTISSTMMTQAAPSTTQLEAREVGDEIRYLGFGNAVMTSLIQNSLIDTKSGKIKQSKGLITKRAVENIRFEQFNRSPRPIQFTVSSGTEISSSGVVLASVNGLQPGMTLVNTANKTCCRVEVIASTTITGSSFGATTFSCAAGDILMLMAPAVPAGADTNIIVNGTDDNTFNTVQFARLGVSISWVLQAVKQLAGGERLTREKMYLLWEFLADMERSMLLSDYSADVATKDTTTGANTGWTGEYPTTKGLFALAANGYNMQGGLTLAKIRKDLPLAMGDTINDNEEQICFVSNEGYARVQELLQEKHYNTEGEGELKQWGIKSSKLITSGPVLHMIKHSALNVGTLANQMLLFSPYNVGYVYLKGHDVSPNNSIQDNNVHGKIDELYAYFGIETKDAGKSITVVTNCF